MSPALDLQLRHFRQKDLLHITSPTLHSAFVTLGKLHQKEINMALKESLGEFAAKEQKALLQKADLLYQQLQKLSDSYYFKSGQKNYLERYLQALRAYAIGAKITLTEAIYLQLDIYPGCQTLIVHDTEQQIVRFIHTEENALDTHFHTGRYDYRHVEMRFGDTHISFFAYPGLCGWGPAFCFNHRSSVVQMVDDLYAQPIPSDGPLWVNAFVFMTLDAGDPDIVKDLIDRTHHFGGYLFTNGHAAHQVYAHPLTVLSFEALHKNAKLVPSSQFEGGFVTAQSNIPRHPDNLALSESYLPPARSKWNRSRVLLYQEMSRRAKRLEIYGRHLNLRGKNASDTLNHLEKFISSSLGDIEVESSMHAKQYVQTGISSSWTVATLLGYISPKEIRLRVQKSVPETIHTAQLLRDLLRHDLLTQDIFTKTNLALNGPQNH